MLSNDAVIDLADVCMVLEKIKIMTKNKIMI